MLKFDLLNKRYKKAKGKLTNKEVCEKTGLSNYQLIQLEQNSLKITEEIECKLCKLRMYDWLYHYESDRTLSVFGKITIFILAILNYVTLGVIPWVFIITAVILTEVVLETPWFYYIKRKVKSWLRI